MDIDIEQMIEEVLYGDIRAFGEQCDSERMMSTIETQKLLGRARLSGELKKPLHVEYITDAFLAWGDDLKIVYTLIKGYDNA